MVGPAAGGGNIGGSITLTGVSQFVAQANQIIAKYNAITDAALKTAKAVSSSPVARAQAPRGAAPGSVRPRTGGFVGANVRGGPIQAALGIGAFGGGVATAAVAGVAALGAVTVKLTSDVLSLGAAYQEALRDVQVFAPATNAEMAKLNDTTLSLSATWGVSAEAITQGALSLAKAGNSVDQINGGLLENVVILNQASQGEVDMARGADILTQVMTLYNAETIKAAENTHDFTKFNSEATKTVDILTGAVQNSTVGWEEFILQLKNAGPVGALVGLSFEDLATSLAVLNQAGIRGETAGTALRNAILRGIKPTKEAADAMNQYGISLKNADGTMADAETIIGRLEDAFGAQAIESGKITRAQVAEAQARIFNTRQILAGVTLAAQGTEAFRKMQAAIEATSAKEIASDLQFGINKQLTILAKQAEVAALALFNKFEVALTNVLVTINQLVRGLDLKSFFESIGEGINSILTLTNPFTNAWFKMAAAVDLLIFQGFGNLVSAVGRIVTVFLTKLLPAGTTATSVLESIGEVLITLAAGFEVASEILNENADTIGEWAATVFSAIVTTFKDMGTILQTEFNRVVAIFNAVGKAISDALASISLESVAQTILSVLDFLSNGFVSFVIDALKTFESLTGLGKIVSDVFNFIVTAVTENWDTVVQFLSDTWTQITTLFQAALSGLINLLGSWVTGFLGIWSILTGGLSDIIFNQIGKIFDGFITGLQNIINGAIDLVRDLVRGFAAGFAQLVRIVTTAVNAVLDALRKISKLGGGIFHIPGLEAIDAAFKVFDEIAGRVNAAGGNIGDAGANLIADMGNFAAGVSAGAKKFGETVTNSVNDFGARVQAQIEKTRATINESFTKLQTALQRGRPEPKIPDTAPKPPGTRQPPGRVSGPGGGGGGGKDAKETVDELAARIFEALKRVIPAMTQALAQFLAGIAHDFPSRLQPMIDALVDARDIIGEMVLAKKDLLETTIQIIAVERELTRLHAQQRVVELQADVASIKFEKQLFALSRQKAEIERQMWPIEDAIRDIDEQISELQQENLVLTRQRLEIEIQMLPIKRQIENVDKEINKLQEENLQMTAIRLRWEQMMLPIKQQVANIDKEIERVAVRNFALERENLDLTRQALPIQRQIQLIEDQITDSVDKRQQLLARKQELLAQKDVDKVQRALDGITKQLTTAWDNFDVPKILKLEESKKLLEEQLKGAQDNLDKVQQGQKDTETDTELANIELQLQIAALEELLKPIERRQQALEHTQAVQENLNAITKLGLEEQKAALEALLQPMQDVVDSIDAAREIEDLRSKIAINGLEQEKKALEDQLKPLQDKLDAIARQVEEENLRNQLTITHLEEEKRALEKQLKPLEDQRRAIERSTKEIQFQRDEARAAFEERLLEIKEELANEELKRASLEATKLKQEEVFDALIAKFLETMKKSEAFTLEESLEVLKRLKLWDDQNNKLAETVTEFNRLQGAADLAAEAIRKIPTRVDVEIVIHETRTGGSTQPSPVPGQIVPATPPEASNPSPGVLRPAQELQSGGIVQGPFGRPMWVIAHAGERILPFSTVPHSVRSKEATTSTNITYNNITNFQVNPSYSQVQSPISIREDLRALVMAMR